MVKDFIISKEKKIEPTTYMQFSSEELEAEVLSILAPIINRGDRLR